MATGGGGEEVGEREGEAPKGSSWRCTWAPANELEYRRAIRRACLAAAAVLREGGGTSLDAVAAVIRVLEVPMELSELCKVLVANVLKLDPPKSGVKNPIQVALHLAKEQMSGSSLLGFWSVREHANGQNWLVTGNAKAQWVKYSALLASAKESVNRSTASASASASESSSIQLDPSDEPSVKQLSEWSANIMEDFKNPNAPKASNSESSADKGDVNVGVKSAENLMEQVASLGST